MAKPQSVVLDLNNPPFQDQLFALDVEELVLVIAAFKKLRKLDWPTLHQHTGFKWEDAGHDDKAPNGSSIKSLRITQKVRALAYREGNFIRLLSLHFDHDGAYR
ncbi:MAG: hypothetical protein Q8O67_07075 [Deltaproteobacteria bacterium]|nr:hypothetical protein [Deltaproteobacteria bacterium]